MYRLTNDESALICPQCKDEDSCTHADVISGGVRQKEDGDVSTFEINSTGEIKRDLGYCPTGEHVGEGRRHRFAIRVECEFCGGISWLVFTQHKGVTFVEWDIEKNGSGKGYEIANPGVAPSNWLDDLLNPGTYRAHE